MSKRVITVIEIGTVVLFVIFFVQWAWTQNRLLDAYTLASGFGLICLEIYRSLVSKDMSKHKTFSDDMSKHKTFSDELLPIRGCEDPQRAGDVIFVHGLNGNPQEYWCHDGKLENSWPVWLGEDLSDVGVWSLRGIGVRGIGVRGIGVRGIGVRGIAGHRGASGSGASRGIGVRPI